MAFLIASFTILLLLSYTNLAAGPGRAVQISLLDISHFTGFAAERYAIRSRAVSSACHVLNTIL